MNLPELVPQDGSTEAAASPLTDSATEAIATPLLQPEGSFIDNALDSDALKGFNERRSLRVLWIVLGVILGLILAVYFGFSVFFMSHFTFNTTVNGVDVSLMSAGDVDAHLATEISAYTLQIEAREDQGVVIHGDQIDLNYVSDGQMEARVASQMAWAWPLALFTDSVSNIQHVNVEYDDAKLSTVLDSFAILDEKQMRQPTDAHLAFEGNAYVIAGSDEGTTLDVEKTEQRIAEAIDEGETTLSLEEAGLYIRPTIPEDDPALVADRDRFNKYVPFQIIYLLDDRDVVLDGYTTINWVDTSGEGPYDLNSEAVSSWVAELAASYDTVGATRTIVNGYGEEKTVSGGTYGWEIDQEAEYWAIMGAAEEHRGERREPYNLGAAKSRDEQDWGTTYLEVDLSHQHMWYFVDGKCVLETDVVTGNPNTGYATPQGVYYIFSKSMNVTTRGDLLPDGSYEWEVPVTYWMPFTYSGCGFHDADWQPSFGGDVYTYRGSHGCINMPPELAKELYSKVEAGTPVITHY